MEKNAVKEVSERFLDGHKEGSLKCPECLWGYPQPCSCGGVVHGEKVRVNEDAYVTVTECDKCGRHR